MSRGQTGYLQKLAMQYGWNRKALVWTKEKIRLFTTPAQIVGLCPNTFSTVNMFMLLLSHFRSVQSEVSTLHSEKYVLYAVKVFMERELRDSSNIVDAPDGKVGKALVSTLNRINNKERQFCGIKHTDRVWSRLYCPHYPSSFKEARRSVTVWDGQGTCGHTMVRNAKWEIPEIKWKLYCLWTLAELGISDKIADSLSAAGLVIFAQIRLDRHNWKVAFVELLYVHLCGQLWLMASRSLKLWEVPEVVYQPSFAGPE